MMGWLWILALLSAAMGLMALPLRRAGTSILPVATLLLLGVAGYAMQGHPEAPGVPPGALSSSTRSESAIAQEVDKAAKAAGGPMQLLMLADSYQQRGDYRMAAQLLAKATRIDSANADLWVALGNALVLHANGMVTPAASHAFDRALAIRPDHPGPVFFRGLALAQAGQYEDAATIWRALLARTPADAPWRTDLEQRLAGIERGLGDSMSSSSTAPSRQ